ncbi:MAG: hypothetical protein QHC90_24785 [Shinella sp.]|nr:hypothetical protein [Shinella sp.]
MIRQAFLAGFLVVAAFVLPAPAQEEQSPVPPTVTFVVSTGFWEEGPQTEGLAPKTEEAEQAASNGEPRRGYYKLIALRQPDGTAQVHLQQIEATAQGPQVLSSAALEEFSAMKPYVTDIRPENSSGITTQPGLFATVYLKTDPKATEPESWTVLIDDLGDIKVERATN